MATKASWSSRWIILIAGAGHYNFYWRVVAISIIATRFYYFRFCSAAFDTQPRSSGSRFLSFVADVFAWLGLLVLIIWCCSLTPVHVFTPTFMDLWASPAERLPSRSVDVLYDRGNDTVVEYAK